MHDHFVSLLFKHSRIRSEIDRERGQPRPDWMRLFRLKRIGLKLKSQMAAAIARRLERGAFRGAFQPILAVASSGRFQRLPHRGRA